MGCEWEKMRSQLGPGSRLLISTLWRSMKYILLWFVPWVQVLIVCRIHWCHSAFALQTATYITLLHITATPHTSSHMAPRLDLSVEAVAQLLPRLQTPEQHGWTGTTSVDVASRARYDLLRLATTCYDLLRLGDLLHILYISSTLYTPSSVCLLNLLTAQSLYPTPMWGLSHQFPETVAATCQQLILCQLFSELRCTILLCQDDQAGWSFNIVQSWEKKVREIWKKSALACFGNLQFNLTNRFKQKTREGEEAAWNH